MLIEIFFKYKTWEKKILVYSSNNIQIIFSCKFRKKERPAMCSGPKKQVCHNSHCLRNLIIQNRKFCKKKQCWFPGWLVGLMLILYPIHI